MKKLQLLKSNEDETPRSGEPSPEPPSSQAPLAGSPEPGSPAEPYSGRNELPPFDSDPGSMHQSRSLCFIGLGNPGPEYDATRHNIGFWLMDAIAAEAGLKFRKRLFSSYASCRIAVQQLPGYAGEALLYDEIILVKPHTYMNKSGQVIPHLLRKFGRPMQFVVAVDNMDLPAGSLRMKKRGGTAGHNGLKSMVRYLDRDFYPVYLGIGRPAPGEEVISHVIGAPGCEEADIYQNAISRAVPLLLKLSTQAPDKLLQEINTDPTVSAAQDTAAVN